MSYTIKTYSDGTQTVTKNLSSDDVIAAGIAYMEIAKVIIIIAMPIFAIGFTFTFISNWELYKFPINYMAGFYHYTVTYLMEGFSALISYIALGIDWCAEQTLTKYHNLNNILTFVFPSIGLTVFLIALLDITIFLFNIYNKKPFKTIFKSIFALFIANGLFILLGILVFWLMDSSFMIDGLKFSDIEMKF